MTDVFDGMAGVINSVLGDRVTVAPAMGAPFDLHAIFREDPVEVLDDEGRGVLLMSPSLSVQKPDDVLLTRGDVIQPPDGRSFKIVNGQPNGSPATDAFVIFELEESIP